MAGPPGASAGIFPSSSFSDVLQLGGGGQGKPYQASAESTSRAINSPNAFLAIPGIGAAGDVTKADFLYFKSDGPVTLQLTQDDGTGNGTVVAAVPVNGFVAMEFPSNQPLLGLSVKGSARCTFFASGPV